jgi:acid phosphatase type 7
VRGIRQITVGTGGGALYPSITSAVNTEAIASVYGVLKLVLSDGGYQWQFVPVPGTSFSDAGSGQCH